MNKFTQEEIKELITRAEAVCDENKRSHEKCIEGAVGSFKDHTIKVLTNNEHVQAFECRNKSGSWCYGFRVVCSDNLICMYGDIGELVVLPGYNRDGIRWLRGSLKSKDYFVSKFDRVYYKDASEFNQENAIEAVLGYIYDDLEEVEEYQQGELNLLNDCLDGVFETEEKFYEAAYYDYDLDEPPTPRRATVNFEYRYAALQRLCELLDEIDFSIDRGNNEQKTQ